MEVRTTPAVLNNRKPPEQQFVRAGGQALELASSSERIPETVSPRNFGLKSASEIPRAFVLPVPGLASGGSVAHAAEHFLRRGLVIFH